MCDECVYVARKKQSEPANDCNGYVNQTKKKKINEQKKTQEAINMYNIECEFIKENNRTHQIGIWQKTR